MDYKFIHFIIMACAFFAVGIFFFKIAKERRQTHVETKAAGTITHIQTTDAGNKRVHVEVLLNGEYYPDCVIYCKQCPTRAAAGMQVTVACYKNKDGVLKGRILDEGFEPMPAATYVLPVLFLILGALSAGAAVYFIIKNFVK